MKRKRKESCPSPVLDDSPKRTKVQAQRKFAQNSGMHSPIITPIRDLETTDLLPHTSVLREPVELLPMKRPNTEDFLTFLCFRGTPILPSNLQFFNTASIVTDGQVHEIKGDSPKNGPIDISKCTGSSSDKPFIAFGVRKRADPIVISRQMERKRRHALAIQALRRKYQEQKMAKIRALTISKLSEKTTNKTLVKTNTIQKTETVTKKTNTLQKTNTMQKTKVIATKHVKVTTQTLKTKVKPKMCLRSFGGKFIQKELPFRARRALQERETAKKRGDVKSVVRTSKNSNKPEVLVNKLKHISKTPLKSPAESQQTVKVSSNARVTRSGSITTVVRNPGTIVKRPQVKRRILLPSTTISVVKPKLRSTTTKKTVISRKKAQQRLRVSLGRNKTPKSPEVQQSLPKEGANRPVVSEIVGKTEKEAVKKLQEKDASKNVSVEVSKKLLSPENAKKPQEVSKRITRKDSGMAIKNVPEKVPDKNELKKEVTKNLELKREVKIAETSAKKEVKKNINMKREFKLKSNSKDVKKNVDLKKTSNSVLEKNEGGQKVKRDVKTVEVTVKKIVTRKSEETRQREANPPEEKLKEKVKRASNKPARPSTSEEKETVSHEKKRTSRSASKANEVEKNQPAEEKLTENIKRVTRSPPKGSCIQKKNSDIDETSFEESKQVIAKNNSSECMMELDSTKTEPIDRKESKKLGEKTTPKELAPKKVQKEESSTKLKKELEVKNPSDKTAAVKEELMEEFISKKTSKEIVKKGLLRTHSPSKNTSKEPLISKKTTKNSTKQTSKEALKEPSALDITTAIKSPPNAELTPQEISEDNLTLTKGATSKLTLKEELVPEKAIEKELPLKTTVNKITSEEVVTVQAVPKEELASKKAKDSTVQAVPKEELASKKAKDSFTKRTVAEQSILPSNLSTKGPVTNPISKEELIAQKGLEKEHLSEKITEQSVVKPIPKDKKSTKQLPEDKPLKKLTTKNTFEQDLKVKIANKELEEEDIASKKTNTEYVAKRTSREEMIAMILSEEDIALKRTSKEPFGKNTPTPKKAPKQESSAKKALKEEGAKKKTTPKREESEQTIQKASPRPSRKTKEAAAIYMEILSHKLVNDSTIDDDNVSIDSFPELPNVKKTEQREIELKAQAKTSKEEEGRSLQLVEKIDEKKGKKISKGKKDETLMLESNSNIKEALNSETDVDKGTQSNPSEEGFRKNLSESLKSPTCEKISPKLKSPSTEKTKKNWKNPDPEKLTQLKSSLGKRKSNPLTIASDSESDNEVLQAKIRKCEGQKNIQDNSEKIVAKKCVQKQEISPKAAVEEETSTRRQTRRSTQNFKESESDSSDESFHIDIRVPRKKKVTRSQNRACISSISVLEKNVDIILEAARVLEGEKVLELEASPVDDVKKIDVVEKTDIDYEKIDEQPLKTILKDEKTSKNLSESVKSSEKLKNIKINDSLPKNSKKGRSADTQSDSDESTTSDINLKSLQVRQRNKKLSKTKSIKSSIKSAASFSDSDEEPLAKLTVKNTPPEIEEPKKKPVKSKAAARKTADKGLVEVSVMEPKPKRECTKRPSNYLPMLSSSDEDDEPFFHGFNTSKEDLHRPKSFVQSLVPSLDLLNKDIGRKGKVNMSNEQIEQWLKDSALAGSSVAKENDAMLKFGEKIPVESSVVESDAEPRDIQDLKLVEPDEAQCKESELQQCISKKMLSQEEKPKCELKSPLADRKWIFKKDKKDLTPNKNAFSPENECSVYAFGEETEDVISTPFRRPSRRPSSTATSRSEDELSKNDENSKQVQFRKPGLLPSDSEDSRCFNIPQNPTKLPKTTKFDSMVPPSTSYHCKRPAKSTMERFPEPFDEFKYKIPSSPSASSGSSAKLYKKGTHKQKGKVWEVISPVYLSDFPKPTDLPKLVEAPVFHPTDQEFQDPLEYIERIRHKAEQFGICKIVPPSSFKPECKVSDDMRFTAYNQYVHKMLHRWGPNFKEFMVIKKYLATQNIPLKTPPLIGGMEIDLPRLYQTVQGLGGLKEVIEKKKWSKVSDHMKIPKLAQDRVTKLDDIYCKYLLPYDTLSPAEREKLFDEVETYWAKRESKNLAKSEIKTEIKPEESFEQDDYESDDNEAEECTVKSKNMALNAFYRIARNTMSMYFKVAEPTAQEVEQEFWRYVTQKQNHICVHSASIDCGNWGYGFPVSKNSPFARHSWNLKVMSNNSGSVLRSLGPVMGVTIPTLHVGMVFSTCCWYRDPHGLPWVEYLHTGGNKIWYGIPSSSCDVFQAAMRKLVPNYCRDKELWLPSDTAMVPPGLLMEHNVSLCRTVQEPGQFLVVFPKVFTSSVSTGYVVSESVYFAPLYWLRTARTLFNGLKNSCEPSMFSLDKLLISIAMDARSSVEVLRVVIPFLEELYIKERDYRVKLRNFGKIEEEKITSSEVGNKKKKMQNVEDVECEVCRMNLYVSMVVDTQDDLIYCLEHAIDLVSKNGKTIERLKLRYAFHETELETIPGKIGFTIEAKLQKKVPSKYAGLPTMLK